MLNVISISLGSSKRNHRAVTQVGDVNVQVERIGTDGSITRAIELIQKLDGRIDAFGMGGIDLKIVAGDRSYTFRDAEKIASHAVLTPIVDGSGLKNTLERKVVRDLHQSGFTFHGKKVLLVSSVDRFGMAEALFEAGAEMVLGDLMFGVGLPIPIRSLLGLQRIARVALPILTRLPFQWLYPTGLKQETQKPKFEERYRWADVIAGDFHYIRRHMPLNLEGKIILTNTITQQDVQELKKRRVSQLITTTPSLNGRSFGTNVMEAIIIAVSGKKPCEMTPSIYEGWLEQMGWTPRIELFGM